MLLATYKIIHATNERLARNMRSHRCKGLLGCLAMLVSFSAYAVTPSDQGFNSETPDYLPNAGHTLAGATYRLVTPTSGDGAVLALFSVPANVSITPNASDNAVIFNYDGATVIAGALDARITSADGSEFRIVSMEVDTGVGLGTSSNLTVTGYRDGTSVASDTINTGSSDSSGSVTYTKNGVVAGFGGTITFNSDWNYVDEISFTGTNIIVAVDDLDFEPGIPPQPSVTDARISISGATGTGGAYKIGDTVTAIWNNTAGGDNNSGITGVTVDFSAFGGGAAVVASNTGGTWIATYTIVAGAIDGTNRNVNVTATNASGSTTTADTTNATVDNIAPTVTDGRISISGASGTSGAYKTSDTVTATWNNTAGGDNNSDTISSATVNFTQFGGGASVAATNSSGTWTATYTIVAGAIDNTNRNVTVTATDNAGNIVSTSDSSNATVDNIAPTVSSVTPSGAAISSDTTVGFMVDFSESVTGVSSDKFALGITGTANGTISSVTGSGSSFTVTVSGITGNGTIKVNLNASTNIVDDAGNGISAYSSGSTHTVFIPTAPNAPTIGTATADDGQAYVTFTAPGNNGGSAITTYTATASPGGAFGTCAGPAACTATVTGLDNGTAYTFTVTATNAFGTSTASGASNSVTPKGNQTITFANPGSQNFGTSPTLSAMTTASGLIVTFSSATTGVCTVTSGGALTFVTPGSCTIDADQAGNSATNAAATVTRTFTVNAVVPGAPTVGTATAGDTQASVNFTAPASNGGNTITGYTVTSNPGGFTGTGAGSPLIVTGLTNGVSYTFTVTATNSAGTSAPSVASNSITPAANQTITFSSPGAQNFGTSPTLSASSDSGLTPTFTSSSTGVCTVTSGGTLTFVTVGNCTINADQAGNSAYLPATQVSRSFSVNPVVPGNPTIGIATAGNAQASVAFVAPTFSGGANITSYEVTSNPGGVSGTGSASPITVAGLTNGIAYTFTVTATNSAGSGGASAASNSITPAAAQTITFANPGPQNFGTTPTLIATTDATGLTPTFTSSTTGVCTVTTGGTLTFVTAGVCTINADQAGNGSYMAATQVIQSFVVNAIVPDAPIAPIATAGAAQASISFSAPISAGGAAITGYTVTSNPHGLIGSGVTSPISVTGLTNGTAYSFTVTATNSAGTGAASVATNSVTPNGAPTINGIPTLTVNQNTPYQFMPVAADSVGDTLTFSITNKPTWLVFNTATGMLSGTPLNQDVGVTTGIVISVTDGTLSASLPAFNLTVTNVNDAPTITSTAITTATQDSAYSYTFVATDSDAGDALTLSAVTKPSWLSFNAATGVLSGTPSNTEVGSHAVTLRATDTDGLTIDQTFSITVSNVNDAPTITSTAITTATQDTAYSYTFVATDSDAGDALTLSAVTKPSWLSFNAATGVLSGTPSNTEVGSHAVTLRATDTDGLTIDQTFSITVSNVNDAPTITSTAITTATQDTAYSYTFVATDSDAGDALTLSAVTKPSWLSFNAATGVLSGTPSNTEVGSHAVTLRATDTDGLTIDQTFSITVTNVNDAPVATSATFIVEEDGSVMVTLTGEDADNDALTFEVMTQPESGVLAQHGNVWLYTPEKDFNGTDQFNFIAKDAELSSEPAVITLQVTGVNDEPQAVDDSFALESRSDDSYSLAVLANDIDVDGDTLTIDGAAADIGSVQITDAGLMFVAPTAYIGPVELRYTISDGHKGRANAKVQVLIEGAESELQPVITVPADIDINAKGLLTRVKLGAATAVDRNGLPLAVSLVNQKLLFAPGSYLAYWQTTDSEGNKAIKAQSVRVHPQVSLSHGDKVGEGNEVVLGVHLNGTAPTYPLSIPYTVSGTADGSDHDLVDGVVEITSGLMGEIRFNTVSDGVAEADETVIVSLDSSFNLGGQSQAKVVITEENIAPKVELSVTQVGERRLIVSQNQGNVQIAARVSDANEADTLTQAWSSNGLTLQENELGTYFNPEATVPGMYAVSLTASDDGQPALSSTDTVHVLVLASLPSLTAADSDGDLIPDNQEGFTDSDSDGIPDFLDARSECAVMPEADPLSALFLAEVSAGSCLHLGQVALRQQLSGVQLSISDLAGDNTATNIGGVFDFIITGLPETGQSDSIVIPQRLPVPANAVYRKLRAGEWQDFVINERNHIATAAGERGFCPPPGDAQWTPGLTEGHWCVQLTIEDGGPNDDDGIANRRVVDPGGVAVVLNGNHLPVANSDSLTIALNQAVDVDVLANDTDVDGDSLVINQAVSQFGSVTILPNQQLSYTPAFGFIGADIVTYSITDNRGGTATNELTITVQSNGAPVAVGDVAATDDRTSLLLNVLANDTDPDGNSLSLVGVWAQQGQVAIEAGQLRYIPKAGFEGVDSVTYQISDGLGGEASGEVLITVTAYKAVVVENSAGGGSMSWLWMAFMLLFGSVRRVSGQQKSVWGKSYSIATLAIVLCALSPAIKAKAAESGIYVEAFVGQATADSKMASLSHNAAGGQITDIDNTDTAYGASIGYQWNPYVATELGYLDLGEGSAQITGSSLTPLQYHEQVKAVTPVLAEGALIGLRFTLLQHEGWRFDVPLGLFMWQAEINSQFAGNTLNTELDGTDIYTGVRFSYDLSETWSLGVGYLYLALEPNDVILSQLNVRYQF